MNKVLTGAVIALVGLALGGKAAKGQLNFNFNPAAGTSQQAIDGFQDAAARWSAIFDDNITVELDIGFSSLGGSTLAQASSGLVTTSYSAFRTQYSADATSTDDAIALANLSTGMTFDTFINETANNPNGAGSATPYVETGNGTIIFTQANAKALGFAGFMGADASITFNSDFTFDFDPTDGIMAGAIDFVGVATHEIGHALGFISEVDFLDNNPDTMSDSDIFATPLDFFRYSADSVAAGNVIDVTADNRAKFFSIDGGTTQITTFSRGVNFGDGQQASHWQDNLGIGILDPTAANGELLSISAFDIQALDVIGYNLAPATVPEPGTVIGTGAAVILGALLYVKRDRDRKSQGSL